MRFSYLIILFLFAYGWSKVDFNTQIRPILSDNCFHCHGPDKQTQKAGLRLDVSEGLYDVSGGWAYINPGKPEKSLVYYHITTKEKDEIMPPLKSERKLTSEQIALVKQWIIEGGEYEEHWSFTPMVNEFTKFETDDPWVKNEIDHFILARLKNEKLSPTRPASKEKLVRRVYLQLTGLPPKPEEIKSYLADKSPDAYTDLINRLLASDGYAERQTLKWMEVARYGDTDGYQKDYPRYMWPWRDWVINAYKRNMPYNDFLVHQLAGDLLPDRNLNSQIATGFNRNHRINSEGGIIPEEFRVENAMDRAVTVGTAMMGLTMECARCHDHKYDPISQKEFFQLYAYFASAFDHGVGSMGGNSPPFVQLGEEWSIDKEVPVKEPFLHNLHFQSPFKEKLKKQVKDLLERMKVEGESSVSKELEQLKEKYPKIDFSNIKLNNPNKKPKPKPNFNNKAYSAMVMMEDPSPKPVYILNRGVYSDPLMDEEIFPGVPEVLNREIKQVPKNRYEFAQWLVHPKNPLTARVYVNRIWANLFGRGLVKSVDNLGSQGEIPTHKELLDWLALFTIEHGWDQRKLIKKILTSATYRQSAIVSREDHVENPDIKFYHRGPRFRLDAYALRDQSLYMANLLYQKVGGASVKPYMPVGIWTEIGSLKNSKYKQDKAPDIYRKSMYTYWKRTAPPPTMIGFNASRRVNCTVENFETNTPLQALTLFNNVTFVESAKGMALMLAQRKESLKDKINYVFQFATGRLPEKAEIKTLMSTYRSAKKEYTLFKEEKSQLFEHGELNVPVEYRTSTVAALMSICKVILNLDETITLE